MWEWLFRTMWERLYETLLQRVCGTIWRGLGRLFHRARNTAEHEVRIVALETRANDHEKRIRFLELYRVVQAEVIAKIYELQAIQSNQAIRLGNLAQTVEAELLPRLQQLESMTSEDADRNAVVNLRKQVKNNLTRARKKVG